MSCHPHFSVVKHLSFLCKHVIMNYKLYHDKNLRIKALFQYIIHFPAVAVYLEVKRVEDFCNKNQRAVYQFHSIFVVSVCNRQLHCCLDTQTRSSITTTPSLTGFDSPA